MKYKYFITSSIKKYKGQSTSRKQIIFPSFLYYPAISAQTKNYIEDFNTKSSKGLARNTIDTLGLTNWSFDLSNRISTSGSDCFKVSSEMFELFNTDSYAFITVHWYSHITRLSAYNNVATTAVLVRINSNSS
jgi:hypothetical protein